MQYSLLKMRKIPISKKLAEIGTVKTVGNKRVIGYSPEFKEFIKKNRGTFTYARKLMIQNLGKIIKGETIESNGIRMRQEQTGEDYHPGRPRRLSIRATTKGYDFFIRWSVGTSEHLFSLTAHNRAQKALEQIGHKFKGYNVQLIKPHFLYRAETKKEPIIIKVTDFYKENEVVSAGIIKSIKFKRVLKELEDYMYSNKVYDASSQNAFYAPRTRTILLFDISILPKEQ